MDENLNKWSTTQWQSALLLLFGHNKLLVCILLYCQHMCVGPHNSATFIFTLLQNRVFVDVYNTKCFCRQLLQQGFLQSFTVLFINY